MSTEQVGLKELLKSRNMRLSQLALLLDVDKSVTTRWAQKKIPAERVIEVEGATGIPRQKLRPDLYGTPAKKKGGK